LNGTRRRTKRTKRSTTFLLRWLSMLFLILNRVIVEDQTHSSDESRFYCIGRVDDAIMTVRFTYRGNIIRIYGAGYWRRGRKIYEDQNKIY
jgi:hypothetical protein